MNRGDRLYRRIPILLIARRNLTRTTIRSMLATLGIVIGVIAIASLGLFGMALQTSVNASLGDFGTQIVVSQGEDVDSLTEGDVREIRRVSDDAAVIPISQPETLSTITHRGENRRVSVYGVANPGDAYRPSAGRIPDQLRSGAVVGADVARDFDLRIGDSLVVDGRTYRVLAILESQEQFTPVSVDGAVILPQRDVRADGYSQVIVTTGSAEQSNATAIAIRETLNDREERVSIFELGQLTEQIGEAFGAINLFLVGIGSISLFVAGVSILNVMLMSTIERRGEIGVLRAVGYQRMDVLRIMLAEALLLGIMGGIVGSVVSIGAGMLIYQLIVGDALSMFTLTNGFYVAAAFGFAIVTSVISGLYPAYKAANEQPVEALRN